MLHDRVAIERTLEVVARPPSGPHEVLADELDEIERRSLGEQPPIVGHAQAHTDPEIRQSEPRVRHFRAPK